MLPFWDRTKLTPLLPHCSNAYDRVGVIWLYPLQSLYLILFLKLGSMCDYPVPKTDSSISVVFCSSSHIIADSVLSYQCQSLGWQCLWQHLIFHILIYNFCRPWKISFMILFLCFSYFILADHTKQSPAAIRRDLHKLEKRVHRNITKFNSEECKALQLRETTPYTSICWEPPSREITWQERLWGFWMPRETWASNEHLRPSRPMVSWGALGKTLPAGWGRPSFSPAQH